MKLIERDDLIAIGVARGDHQVQHTRMLLPVAIDIDDSAVYIHSYTKKSTYLPVICAGVPAGQCQDTAGAGRGLGLPRVQRAARHQLRRHRRGEQREYCPETSHHQYEEL